MSEKCIFKGCKTPRIGNGLCKHHYNVANNLVRKGKTTWAKLVKEGHALPSARDPKAREVFLSTKEPAKDLSPS